MSKKFYDIAVSTESTMSEIIPLYEFDDNQINQINSVVSGDIHALEQLFIYSNELLGYKAIAEEALKNNLALSPISSQLLSTAIESMKDRLGMLDRKIIPSLEAFESKYSNISATKIAVEGIGTMFKKIWEFIAGVFARIRDAIKKFFSFFIGKSNGSAENIKKEQDKYNKSYSSNNYNTSNTLKSDQRGVEQIIQAFTYKGVVNYDSMATILNNNEQVLSTFSSIIDTLETHISDLENKERNDVVIRDITSKFNSSFTGSSNSKEIRNSNPVGYSNVYEFKTDGKGTFTVDRITISSEMAKCASKLTDSEIKKSFDLSLKYATFRDKIYDGSKNKTNKFMDSLNAIIVNTKKDIDDGNINTDLETKTALTKSFLRFISHYISSYEDFKRIDSVSARYRKASQET